MFDFVSKAVNKIFGAKSDRDLKDILPRIADVNAEYAKLSSLSDDELRGQTQSLYDEIDAHLKEVDDQIAALQKRINEEENLPIQEKEAIFKQIDSLEEQRNKELEVVLEEILPRAFAVVKETARRFSQNKELRTTATDKDREIAEELAQKEGYIQHVRIEGDQSIWQNRWTAAGSEVEWNMLHYDVQIVGGIVLHQGKIAEMATGEGKTLVATLPAYLNALARRGVHIVTVNDYLAKRDSEWMAPIFEFHGMRVDCIDKHPSNSKARRKAYAADVTYGTNNEFGFDYLRDNMGREVDDLVQRRHHYAMVDEVDSVLIDDARTPLIISGPVSTDNKQEFEAYKPRVERLVMDQQRIVSEFLRDAKKLIAEGNLADGGLALLRAQRGLPKFKPLIKFLSAQGNKAILQKTENYYLQDNSREMPKADAPLLFTIDEKNNSVDLTEKGLEKLTKSNEDAGFFVLPDIGTEIAKIEKDETLSDEKIVEQKEELIREYNAKTSRIHAVTQLLKAYALFDINQDYVVQDQKVMIVDEQTGRIMDGRRYSDGLHQALEAKEGVKIEDPTQTYATITLQNYFRMYHKLAGMTGTAETEATEFWEIYELDVVVIPTNRPIARDDMQDKVYKTVREKFNAVVEEIQALTEAGRPVLVGTTTVENSEILSRLLRLRGIKHEVLNAKQHAREADIVAQAGLPGNVTIATNMAGRGTDIKISDQVKDAGGLAIIGTERHESRRVDRQLRGRAGRQGDPGSSQFFVSLEDHLMRLFMPERIAKIMDKLGLEEGEVIQHSMVTKSIERAQRKVEENNFATRKRLLEYDDVMNAQRKAVYRLRRNALYGERLQLDLMNMFFEALKAIVTQNQGDLRNFQLEMLTTFGFEPELTEDELNTGDIVGLTQQLFQETYKKYQEKMGAIIERSKPIFEDILNDPNAPDQVVVPFTDGQGMIQILVDVKEAKETEGRSLVKTVEQMITLSLIDDGWKEHLREMDDLRQQVQFASVEQKDPLLIYKFEGFELFKAFLVDMQTRVSGFLAKCGIPQPDPEEIKAMQEAERRRMERERKVARQRLETQKAEMANLQQQAARQQANADGLEVDVEEVGGEPQAKKVAPRRVEKLPGRNDSVNVRYADGTIKKNVKFKKVEQDVKDGKCELL